MFKVKSYAQLKIIQIYVVVALITSLVIAGFGYAKTTSYTNKQVSSTSDEFSFTLSGTKFNISRIIKSEENNQLCVIASTSDLDKLAYSNGFQFFYSCDIEQLDVSSYMYPTGKLIIIMKSIDPDFLKTTKMGIVLRTIDSMVRTDDITTGDATDSQYDQARINLNPSAQSISSVNGVITADNAYSLLLSDSTYESAYTACSNKLADIETSFAQYNEYINQLESLNLSFDGLPTELDGDAVSEDKTELLTDYVFSNGVNFKYDDCESFLEANGISTYSQLKDYLSVLADTSATRLDIESLTYKFVDSGEVATSTNTTANQYTAMVRLNNVVTTLYTQKAEYQAANLISVLNVKLAEMEEINQYLDVKTEVFKI